MTLHSDLYPSNDTIRDILATYDDYYTALHSALCNPERPPERYTKLKQTLNSHYGAVLVQTSPR
jgi:hypothetical protein